MIYIVFQLGNYRSAVRLYEMSDKVLLSKMQLECETAVLPIPKTVYDAIVYFQTTVFQLEYFMDIRDAEAWAESYTGFRAEEVKAEIARYREQIAAADHRIVAV